MSERDSLGSSRRPIGAKVLATALTVALAFAVLAPPFAWAEAESEGEGSAQPGVPIPGLEEGPAFEPGGEETSLEEVPAAVGEEGAEAMAPVEPGPVLTPEEPVPPASVGAEATQAPAEQAPPIVEPPPSATTTGPMYGTPEEAGPRYEAASSPTPPEEPIRNEVIVAPPSPPSPTPKTGKPAQEAQQVSPETGSAPAPGPAPSPQEPPVTSPPQTPAAAALAGSLRAQKFHTVAAGECLWSMAEAVLPEGATNAEVAAEVARLWHLNAARIGTGDPNLILVRTVLRLQ